MDPLKKLTYHLTKLPSVGEKQAYRYAQRLITLPKKEIEEFVSTLVDTHTNTKVCPTCNALFTDTNNMCSICNDDNRDTTTIMLVEKDNDMYNIEKINMYSGRYYIVGRDTTASNLLDSSVYKNFLSTLKNNPSITAIVSALPALPEYDYIITSLIKNIGKHYTITQLGRGLSQGLGIEYSDAQTIKHALSRQEKLN